MLTCIYIFLVPQNKETNVQKQSMLQTGTFTFRTANAFLLDGSVHLPSGLFVCRLAPRTLFDLISHLLLDPTDCPCSTIH